MEDIKSLTKKITMLKRINKILLLYVALSIFIMIYNFI
ncbi:hypothetical protein QFZ20_005128 [Flavobacterium sp. W4I14]|nr:hypothetical protein [Flavobacterium sp. W4I14]